MMKRALIFVVIVMVLVGFADLVLPTVVSQMVATGMGELFASNAVSAKVEKSPALGMLNGSFDTVTVDAQDAKLDKIAFSNVHAVLQGVQLDRQALYANRKVVVDSVRDVDLTVTVTQEELARYLNQSVKGVKNAKVSITGGKVHVSTNLALGPLASLAVTLEGRIVGQGRQIKFVNDRFLLNNASIGNIGGSLLAEIPLVDLQKLPFGVEVREIVMDEGKVTIRTDNRQTGTNS